MIARLTVASLIASVLYLLPTYSLGVSCSSTSGAGSGTGAFTAHATADCERRASEVGADAVPAGAWHTAPVICGARTDLSCEGGQRLCPDETFMTVTWFETTSHAVLWSHNDCADEPADRSPSPSDIVRAFRRIPLPNSTLTVQPPGGETLVNFETNFFTTTKPPFDRTVTLLGHRVDFKIRPTTYTWHFGDGADMSTTTPGAAYPDLDVTHRYRTKGTVHPSVDTTWAADYRVDGQDWHPVDGTVTITGTTRTLTIRSATPLLAG